MENEPKINYLSTESTKETFTINGCGKFAESKLHLNKTEASLLYIELYKWLSENGR